MSSTSLSHVRARLQGGETVVSVVSQALDAAEASQLGAFNTLDREGEEFVGRSAPPLRIARREMRAYITVG